ncbi:MAG: class I SAM-dependent methyltransferase [Prevotella sp.]|nr:class I SAM-dependent methyltransferase [Prevotella sp.]
MTLDDYICTHIDPEPEWLKEVDRQTNLHLYNSRMCSGHLQGRLLKMLVKLSGAKKILEIGSFSGYAALCMAEGLPADGVLHTIEANDELEDFIRRNFTSAPCGDRIRLHIGNALEEIPKLSPQAPFDIVFIDADKRQYTDYYRLVKPLVKKGGLIIADNTLWDGHVIAREKHSSQTYGVMQFNDLAAADPEMEKVILPMRDGLTLIRKI